MRAGHSQQPVRCQCNFLHLAGLCEQWPSCPLDWRRAHSRPPRPLPSGFFFGPVAVMPPGLRVNSPVAVAKPPADRSVDLRGPGSSASQARQARVWTFVFASDRARCSRRHSFPSRIPRIDKTIRLPGMNQDDLAYIQRATLPATSARIRRNCPGRWSWHRCQQPRQPGL